MVKKVAITHVGTDFDIIIFFKVIIIIFILVSNEVVNNFISELFVSNQVQSIKTTTIIINPLFSYMFVFYAIINAFSCCPPRRIQFIFTIFQTNLYCIDPQLILHTCFSHVIWRSLVPTCN